MDTLLRTYGTHPGQGETAVLFGVDVLVDYPWVVIARKRFDVGTLYEVTYSHACEDDDYGMILDTLPETATLLAVRFTRTLPECLCECGRDNCGCLCLCERTAEWWDADWFPAGKYNPNH